MDPNPQAGDLIYNSCGSHTRLRTLVLERNFGQGWSLILLFAIYVHFQLLSKMMVLPFEKLCLQLELEMNSFDQEERN